jgi:hypothetical protein
MSTSVAPSTAVELLLVDLRGRDDDGLAGLLADRPDLLTPMPASLAALARRAASAASAARALDTLDRLELDVVEVLVVLGDSATWAGLTAAMGLPNKGAGSRGPAVTTVRDCLNRLQHLGLVVRDGDRWRPLAGVVEAVGSHPCGLGPPAERLGAAPINNEVLDAALATAPEPAMALLRRLSDGPPTGRGRALDDPDSPGGWLVDNAIAVRTGPDVIVMPREVGLHLRGGLMRVAATESPWQASATRPAADVDAEAAAIALEAVRLAEDLLLSFAEDPPGLLRSGGIGVRDLRRAAANLDVDEPTVVLLAESARAAGLLGVDGDEWRPTTHYDLWLTRAPERRWLDLATGWLHSTRPPGLVGTEDARGRAISALSDALERPAAPLVRTTALLEWAALPPGSMIDADSLVERVAWVLPRRPAGFRGDLVTAAFAEAQRLGVAATGALSTTARLLVQDDPEQAADALAGSWPTPLNHFLLQADLTAVVPGPPTSELRRELSLLADLESTGGATVFRFTEASLRRGLDAGRSGAEIQAFLTASSRTDVPQALTYLVEDAARRHGAVRVGAVGAVIRSDDEAALAQLLASPAATGLRLRRLSANVLATPEDPETVTATLAEAGLSAIEEDLAGMPVQQRRRPRRASPPPPRPEPATPDDRLLAAAVRALRAGEKAAASQAAPRIAGPAASGAIPKLATREVLAALRSAASAGQTVVLGYVDDGGASSQRTVDPLSVAVGWLTGFDHARGEVHTFAVHRITGVRAAQ